MDHLIYIQFYETWYKDFQMLQEVNHSAIDMITYLSPIPKVHYDMSLILTFHHDMTAGTLYYMCDTN